MTSLEQLVAGAQFTILLGKNGAGKSTLLRRLVKPNVKYVSPERGGTLLYDPHVDSTMSSNPTWLQDTRQRNRTEQFRQQSAAQFRMLEIAVLREIEQDPAKRGDPSYTFATILGQINSLLPAIQMRRGDKGFSIADKQGNPISEDNISSGEAELIALTIELLVFSRSKEPDKLLLLDEPDVHLHPDLQQKLVEFIERVASEEGLRVAIATHSTAIIGAFSREADLQIAPITTKDQTQFSPFRRSNVSEEILPVFGAHPLSSVFNLSPVVLVEGEDDKRVLEQIVRSSRGKFRFTPCAVGSVTELAKWEKWLAETLPVLYDAPRAFSMRDRDDSAQCEIDDVGCVTRIRLNCYAIENLLVADECFSDHGMDAGTFRAALEKWIQSYETHPFSEDVRHLYGHFDQRRQMNIKNVRNIVVALLGSNRPWEVIVGQAVARHVDRGDSTGPNSIKTYLGPKAVARLLAPVF